MARKRKPRPTLSQLRARGWFVECRHVHFNPGTTFAPMSEGGKSTELIASTTVVLYDPTIGRLPDGYPDATIEEAHIGKAWCGINDTFKRSRGVGIAVERALYNYWVATGIDVRR